MRTGEILQRHGDVVVPSASTRKIAIMMAALKAVNEGKLALDQPVVMKAKYQKNDSGCFQHLSSDFVIQLRDASPSISQTCFLEFSSQLPLVDLRYPVGRRVSSISASRTAPRQLVFRCTAKGDDVPHWARLSTPGKVWPPAGSPGGLRRMHAWGRPGQNTVYFAYPCLAAEEDPVRFLRAHAQTGVIIDETQKVPTLFSYLQAIVDESGAMGRYILTGSQNFLLLEKITQSLAGRVAISHLMPFSILELEGAERLRSDLDDFLFTGTCNLLQ